MGTRRAPLPQVWPFEGCTLKATTSDSCVPCQKTAAAAGSPGAGISLATSVCSLPALGEPGPVSCLFALSTENVDGGCPHLFCTVPVVGPPSHLVVQAASPTTEQDGSRPASSTGARCPPHPVKAEDSDRVCIKQAEASCKTPEAATDRSEGALQASDSPEPAAWPALESPQRRSVRKRTAIAYSAESDTDMEWVRTVLLLRVAARARSGAGVASLVPRSAVPSGTSEYTLAGQNPPCFCVSAHGPTACQALLNATVDDLSKPLFCSRNWCLRAQSILLADGRSSLPCRGDPNAPHLTEERRRIKRRIANRESARRVRHKKLAALNEVQAQASDIQTDSNDDVAQMRTACLSELHTSLLAVTSKQTVLVHAAMQLDESRDREQSISERLLEVDSTQRATHQELQEVRKQLQEALTAKHLLQAELDLLQQHLQQHHRQHATVR
ncbi:hypothetical protein MMC07_000413 [Pseudocyphellaria aurata]|nr:hypothetical protein [Pseudocyphellaria aurata]